MKKSFVILLHAGVWLCFYLMVAIVLTVYYRTDVNAVNQMDRIMNAFNNIFLFAFLPAAVSFYLYYFVLFPKYLQQKKYVLSLVFGFAISATVAVLAYILHRYFIETGRVMDMDEGGKHGRSTALTTIAVMTFIGIIGGIVGWVVKGFITWFNEIKLKEALKEKNHEMELALVKLQLDPHLLFNTINNIDSLILTDAIAASEYLNRLSDIMRFILYETKSDKIPLTKEIEYIEKYVDLQKIRTANENYVQLTVIGNAGNKFIAPMVLIPFIENAFKHTGNKKLENAIIVQIFIHDHTIQLICENKIDPGKKMKHQAGANSVGGLGNELIEKRLDLIYNGRHTLQTHKTDYLYSINLSIPHE
ncbi:sensor histidine kinase [Runella sp.]|uniref:sensor histidine kinase n=1 Tax=Runella sp. TaxID=1960881 RepID=UPI003D0D886B